ncbi:MAG: hypothetical protein A3F84_01920 [Candidatus Handelsmanbacteria bacterium RIFCSPLOWO2_12_FULL_64_10]|uniref:Oxidoreductase n=1 Tax=Handelsmanbacteria sp. (strain RIFCSPLOWO2_12_FULL_64_10) TaxID=1817868 RepID=A0A1F6CA51_HANXR|nr:MAG: hypothetical protein A3F84_01920 [Candidatus Handelsmanbacteria bacterium RIFCSPLOWO2_12_FULL_64_10]
MGAAEKTIGIGVVGINMGADTLYANNDPSSRLIVRGLCSATEKKVKALAQRWGINLATTDYRDLLKRDDIQVMAIYTPDDQHYEQVMASLSAGKHVVVTKPMVITVEHAKEIAKLARETGLKVLVGQTMRFQPEFMNVKKLVDDGDLGEILFVQTSYLHDMRPVFAKTPWRITEKDFLVGSMCHPIDALRWFLGDVEEVSAYARKSPLLPGHPRESLFSLNLKFKNGAIGHALGLYGIVHPPKPMNEITVYGTKGSVSSDHGDFMEGHMSAVFDKLEGKPKLSVTYPPSSQGSYGHLISVMNYMKHFEACLAEDSEPSPNAEDAFKSLSISVAGWESIRGGKPVRVDSNL